MYSEWDRAIVQTPDMKWYFQKTSFEFKTERLYFQRATVLKEPFERQVQNACDYAVE